MTPHLTRLNRLGKNTSIARPLRHRLTPQRRPLRFLAKHTHTRRARRAVNAYRVANIASGGNADPI
jgi:hypothetical protein